MAGPFVEEYVGATKWRAAFTINGRRRLGRVVGAAGEPHGAVRILSNGKVKTPSLTKPACARTITTLTSNSQG